MRGRTKDKDGDGRVEAEDDGRKHEAPPMYNSRQPQLYTKSGLTVGGWQGAKQSRRE
jgi:hypothetical protein